MDSDQNHRENADEENNECDKRDSQDKFPQTQHPSKRPESSHKSRSRPNSRAASAGEQSRTRSNPQTSKSWNSTNPYINFMTDFRKMQTGQKSTNIFRLGGQQWRNMTEDDKQPFIDAANENKKLKQLQSDRKQQRKPNSLNENQSKTTGTKKNTTPNESSVSQKVVSPKKRKRSQQRHETELKKKRTKSETGTDTDTDTSGSIHTATTDCASEDSDESP